METFSISLNWWYSSFCAFYNFFSFFKLALCILGWESSYECAESSGSADICPASLQLTLWCYRYVQLLCFYVISCHFYTLEKRLYGPFCKYFKLFQINVISAPLPMKQTCYGISYQLELREDNVRKHICTWSGSVLYFKTVED